jgi:hypothetical protein
LLEASHFLVPDAVPGVVNNGGPMRDDATAVMIEWPGSGPALLAV